MQKFSETLFFTEIFFQMLEGAESTQRRKYDNFARGFVNFFPSPEKNNVERKHLHKS